MWDVDEFLVFHEMNTSSSRSSIGGPAPPYETVQDMMRDLCLPHYCGSVGIRWINFGTSNQTYYSKEPVMQRYLYRDEEPDFIIKTIFRLQDFSCTSNAHFAYLREADVSSQGMDLTPPFAYDTLRRIHLGGPMMAAGDENSKHSPAFIHHYTKSLEEWYVRRCISGDVNDKKNIRCNGIYPGSGIIYDDTAAISYQRMVVNSPEISPNQALVPIQKLRDWTHHDVKRFMIKTQTVTVAEALHLRSSRPPPRAKEDQFSSIPSEQRMYGDLLGPIDVYPFMPKELPKPPEAATTNVGGNDTWIQTATTAGGISFPSFQKVREYCIFQIRKMQKRRLEEILLSLVGETNAIGSISTLHVDPAYHNNVGDSLLTVGTLSALARMGISDIKQCHYWQAKNRVPHCDSMILDANLFKDHSNRSKLAVWQPGGNWGDLWVNAHARRMTSFENLLANGYSVIGFPQSLVYRDAQRAKREAAMIKDHISKGLNMSLGSEEGNRLAKKRVTFSWREKQSHSYASELYPYVNNIILPDIAFQLGPFVGKEGIKEAQKVDVVLFMRNDVESVITKDRKDESLITRALRKFSHRDLSYKIVDWPDRLKLFGTNTSHIFARDAIQLVSMGKVIIADRLHATILAYLAGVPVIYLDQLTGKISKSLEVAFDAWEGCQDKKAGQWARAANFSNALEMAAKLVSEWTL